ncbi:MAG: cobaltochelatase subunit CobN [Spirochaetaceae bacterium]|jgi:cobaltochelatase CobN|nr:cobaltochelatase subunit CobN [Spirochaetaceae bacterium]
MNIICIDCDGEYRIWRELFPQTEISVESYSQNHIKRGAIQGKPVKPGAELSAAFAARAGESPTAIIFRHHTMDAEVEEFLRDLPREALIVPIGSEAILLGVSTVTAEQLENINRYLIFGGSENIRNAGLYIRRNLLRDRPPAGENDGIPAPREMPFSGLFSLKGDPFKVYETPEQYLGENYPGGPPPLGYAGIYLYRYNWVQDDLEVFRLLAAALEKEGAGVIPVFSSSDEKSRSFREMVKAFFTMNGKLQIELLVNFQVFPVRAEEGRSVAEQSILEFEALGIPVLAPVQTFYLTRKAWRKSNMPLSADMPMALITPEMSGMIEPVLAAAASGEDGRNEPVPERIEFLARRAARLIVLRKKPNPEKKLVLMLHNAVCNGVEATIGCAFGLEPFKSAVEILRRLKHEGYVTGEIPPDGPALLAQIMEKKAVSDFRWTAAEDILEAGGCVYRMPVKGEYENYYRVLPEELQDQMERTWGQPPGEGMVIGDDIIITGLQFGNITVMVQPKRGCYGAKCTGEVCKILHDPACPPPHQYLASYRYIEHILRADACVEIGTKGSLELLPGKTNALSELCWPHAVLGSLPELYIYHAGVTTEALIAKRRAQAVIVDHLPPASMGADKKSRRLSELIAAYSRARELGNDQRETLEREIRRLIADIPAASRMMERAEDFHRGLAEISDAVNRADRGRQIRSAHVFGEVPDGEEAERYIGEVLEAASIPGESAEAAAMTEKITAGLRRTGEEMDMLIRALAGGYIPAGESGMPDANGAGILPTGRNMTGEQSGRAPSRIAWERGMELARQLLDSYLADEGRLPEKVAMNMISLDISRTGGEQLSQFLYLLGIRPCWDRRGKISGLEVIAPAELGRPRIDVTVRISGVLRDTYPEAVELMDEAALIAAGLEEPDADNYVAKHARAYIGRGVNAAEGRGEEPYRNAAIRVFGDAPGTYGAGLDLALLASAWKDEKDLAKYFVQSSAFAYGKNLEGRKSIREFILNVRETDLSCDVTQSRRQTPLSCDFSTQVQGGFRLAAKYYGGKNIRQYQAKSEREKPVKTESLRAAINGSLEDTLLSEFWKDSAMERGYNGATEILLLFQSAFSAQCVCDCFDDRVLDALAEFYVNDEFTRNWLMENNRFAAEEMARRLLELNSRGKWNGEARVLEELKTNYLTIEGNIEGGIESKGAIQGGTVEIINDENIPLWRKQLVEIEDVLSSLQ